MNVPQYFYLHNQSFNSEFIEFVWKFPLKENEDDQVILKAYKNGILYIEFGTIDENGNYKSPSQNYDGITTEWLKNIPEKDPIKYLERFFTLDVGLVKLVDDSVKFLNEP